LVEEAEANAAEEATKMGEKDDNSKK